MKITITTLILFLSPVFSQYGMLVGKKTQKAALNKLMDTVGVARFNCVPGYLGLDCAIPSSESASKLSCYLKGKPGRSKGGLFINNDYENTVTSAAYTTPVAAVAPTDAPDVPGSPGGPLDARAACPLIVDIQKCMNKCVDDVLN
ncbi:hypothetical protein BB560_006060 [Smittium megazygosporum]|uniref:Uncharacterized protein n=1 Tax=Smittium megazygosporum TaxID=133381 RepID=A0A2T9YJA9_9FUNG|nr:hypothetical protein BB560_006060 [Smittium megazygosporum]